MLSIFFFPLSSVVLVSIRLGALLFIWLLPTMLGHVN
jgi:hypothetical protein